MGELSIGWRRREKNSLAEATSGMWGASTDDTNAPHADQRRKLSDRDLTPHPRMTIFRRDWKRMKGSGFALANLSQSTYTIHAWDEKLGTASQKVTGGKETKVADFVFKARSGIYGGLEHPYLLQTSCPGIVVGAEVRIHGRSQPPIYRYIAWRAPGNRIAELAPPQIVAWQLVCEAG